MHTNGFGRGDTTRAGHAAGHTEHTRQASLLKTGALQDAIFNSAYFSSIATDERGVIQIFNVGAERMLGYKAVDVVNRITPADISDPLELIARAASLSDELDTPISPGFDALVFKASRGIEDIYELTYIRQDGSRFPAIVSVTALRNARDDIIGYLLIGTDNTTRKRFERALEDKNIELEHASRMKSEFLATMSHELRTPLNAIIGFSEALRDGLMGETTAIQHESIDDIFTSGQHLLSLINDILDLSKVEAGMMALELEAVDLRSLLQNSLTIVREKAAAQRIGLELDIGEGLGVVQLDMRKTKQIVYNLLSNAVKFSASGGPVQLRARRVRRDAVGVLDGAWPTHRFPQADNEYNDFVEICVSDHGIGISQDNMGRLFQAFSQIDSSLARKFEGTGLGLAMVKQLTELQGGAVAVASAERQGSRFAVWLPLRAESHASSQL
nr:PAS domain-containing sensor histidine kinase [uncultured Duganella sp.]